MHCTCHGLTEPLLRPCNNSGLKTASAASSSVSGGQAAKLLTIYGPPRPDSTRVGRLMEGELSGGAPYHRGATEVAT